MSFIKTFFGERGLGGVGFIGAGVEHELEYEDVDFEVFLEQDFGCSEGMTEAGAWRIAIVLCKGRRATGDGPSSPSLFIAG